MAHGLRAPLLLAWWLAWVLANLLSGVGSRIASLSGEGIEGVRAKIRVDIAGDAVMAVAAVLAILVVLEIDRRQSRKAPVVRRAIAAWKGAAEETEDGAPAAGR